MNVSEFYIERPSISKKSEILEYLYEMKKYNSKINGMGKLDEYVTNNQDRFEEWLKFLEYGENNGFPLREQYLFVRKLDNKILGMINIRKNAELKSYQFGHVGYSIRPLERNKGYGKIQLYYALMRLQELKIKKCIITTKYNNIISQKLVKYFNGTFQDSKEIDGIMEYYYTIDIDNVIPRNIK